MEIAITCNVDKPGKSRLKTVVSDCLSKNELVLEDKLFPSYYKNQLTLSESLTIAQDLCSAIDNAEEKEDFCSVVISIRSENSAV